MGKVLLCNHEDPSSGLQHLPIGVEVNVVTLVQRGRGRGSPGGSLATQLN